jgi:FxLD family lantipeptide
MSTRTNDPELAPPAPAGEDWDLDVSIVELGPLADELMYVTDDGCGKTCQSACNSCGT